MDKVKGYNQEIEEATLLDLAKIAKVMSLYEGYDCTQFCRGALLDKKIKCFYNKWSNTAMFYLPDGEKGGGGNYDMHIYGTGRGGRELRNWCIGTGEYMFNVVGARLLSNHVKAERRDLRFFMAALGCTKTSTNGGRGGEILYTVKYEDRYKIIERVK